VADAGQVLSEFQTNFTLILQSLRTALPNARIVVSNLYSIPQIPGADQVVPVFNQIVAVSRARSTYRWRMCTAPFRGVMACC